MTLSIVGFWKYGRKKKETGVTHPFPKHKILDSSKLTEFAEDNFRFDENVRKFSKEVEKVKLFVTSNFSFSLSVFKRVLLQTHKNQGLFGKGWRWSISTAEIWLILWVCVKMFHYQLVKNYLCMGKKKWHCQLTRTKYKFRLSWLTKYSPSGEEILSECFQKLPQNARVIGLVLLSS